MKKYASQTQQREKGKGKEKLHQYGLEISQLDNSSVEKDLGNLVDSKLTMCQQHSIVATN